MPSTGREAAPARTPVRKKTDCLGADGITSWFPEAEELAVGMLLSNLTGRQIEPVASSLLWC